MRDNQTLDAEGLRHEAAAAVAASGFNRTEVARMCEVTSGAISRALNPSEKHPQRFADLRRRIIEALTDYTVTDETTPTFRVRRKAQADGV